MVAVMSSFSFESMVSMTMTLVTCYHHHYYCWCYYCCCCYYCHCCFVIVRVENGVETALVSIFHSRRVAINDLLAAVVAVVVVDSLLFLLCSGDQMDTGVKSQVLLLLLKYVPEFSKCSTRNG